MPFGGFFTGRKDGWMDWFIGHLVGDYLLQSNWMAVNKKKAGWQGHWACFTHCALWTLSVCLFAWWWNPVTVACVFFSHWILDRTRLVHLYVKVFRQIEALWLQIVIDNTIHLVLLWLIARFLA